MSLLILSAGFVNARAFIFMSMLFTLFAISCIWVKILLNWFFTSWPAFYICCRHFYSFSFIWFMKSSHDFTCVSCFSFTCCYVSIRSLFTNLSICFRYSPSTFKTWFNSKMQINVHKIIFFILGFICYLEFVTFTFEWFNFRLLV